MSVLCRLVVLALGAVPGVTALSRKQPDLAGSKRSFLAGCAGYFGKCGPYPRIR